MSAFPTNLSEFDERGKGAWHEVYPHEANYDKYQDASLGAHAANEEKERREVLKSVDILTELLGDPF